MILPINIVPGYIISAKLIVNYLQLSLYEKDFVVQLLKTLQSALLIPTTVDKRPRKVAL